MADFMTNLWGAIFEAGPTPTLLVATNATFAALQTLLLALLVATYSIHFVILSVLCGGLWYGINWFAVELAAAQAKEEEAERLRKRRARDGPSSAAGRGDKGDVADDEGEDTEVEGDKSGLGDSVTSLSSEDRYTGQGAATDGNARLLSAVASTSQDRARRRTSQRSGDLSGELSTDSEWEKVDGEHGT